jgi:hypothetical protein
VIANAATVRLINLENKEGDAMSGKKQDTTLMDAVISKNWARVIHYCKTKLPHGEITFQVVNGEPVDLISSKEKIRFDKPDFFPELE